LLLKGLTAEGIDSPQGCRERSRVYFVTVAVVALEAVSAVSFLGLNPVHELLAAVYWDRAVPVFGNVEEGVNGNVAMPAPGTYARGAVDAPLVREAGPPLRRELCEAHCRT